MNAKSGIGKAKLDAWWKIWVRRASCPSGTVVRVGKEQGKSVSEGDRC